MKESLKPHVHAEFIHAFADGHKIESKRIDVEGDDWKLDAEPTWFDSWAYRIYDPLREVKEAFERGETVQYMNSITGDWVNYGGINGVDGISEFLEWKIKPKEELKADDWVILDKHCKRVWRYKDVGDEIVINNVRYNIDNLRKATKQEVLNAPNYDGSATISDFPLIIDDWIKFEDDNKSFQALSSTHINCLLESNFKYYYATKDEIVKPTPTWIQSNDRKLIFQQIESERIRQNEKWGEQNHKPIEWIGILTEEVGEVAKEATEYHFGTVGDLSNYRTELIQVAAVAVSMIECLDSNELKK